MSLSLKIYNWLVIAGFFLLFFQQSNAKGDPSYIILSDCSGFSKNIEQLTEDPSIVLPFDSLDKSTLCKVLNEWFGRRYNGLIPQLVTADTIEGRFVINSKFDYRSQDLVISSGRIDYTLTVLVKDYKIKVTFSGMTHVGNLASGGLLVNPTPQSALISQVRWEQIRTEAYRLAEQYFTHLERFIRTYKAQNDW